MCHRNPLCAILIQSYLISLIGFVSCHSVSQAIETAVCLSHVAVADGLWVIYCEATCLRKVSLDCLCFHMKAWFLITRVLSDVTYSDRGASVPCCCKKPVLHLTRQKTPQHAQYFSAHVFIHSLMMFVWLKSIRILIKEHKMYLSQLIIFSVTFVLR